MFPKPPKPLPSARLVAFRVWNGNMTLNEKVDRLSSPNCLQHTFIGASEWESLQIFGILLKINFDGTSSLPFFVLKIVWNFILGRIFTRSLNSNDGNEDDGDDDDDLYVIDSDFMMSFQTEIQQIFVRMKM